MPYTNTPAPITFTIARAMLRAIANGMPALLTIRDEWDTLDTWRELAVDDGEVRPEHVFPDAIAAANGARALLPVLGNTDSARAAVAAIDADIDDALAAVSREYGRYLLDNDDDDSDVIGASFTWTDDWTDYLPA